MIFLLNFVHFEAFAYFETKIPDRCGRGLNVKSE